jgi:hypothetical protein
MKLSLRESGGVTGLLRECRVDTATLPAAERDRLQELVAASGVTADADLRSGQGADVPAFDLTIESDEQPVRVQVDYASMTKELYPLIEYLSERAVVQKRKRS